ncbi:MAG: DNA recombination protein RmuC [Candidatus Lambdaproteobacteria bacterium]|nr:DNA recombination protein RmuC [Candidatus Lambdaproteobacteria bacterium]
MYEVTALAAIVLAALAAFLAYLAFRRAGRGDSAAAAFKELLLPLLRTETDRTRQATEEQLRGLRQELGTNAKDLREETTTNVRRLGSDMTEALRQIGEQQKERLDNVTTALATLTKTHANSQETLRQSVEGRLDAIRKESADKLEEMRKTVDEKLQTTLETRLGESFTRVVEQLERVHKGIGEMQSLAAGVGDLKKILSNVKVRGTFGEAQLGSLLDQMLSPEQVVKNAATKEGSQERVEFAIKLPGRDDKGPVLLPVDAKFPQEEYQRIIAAAESGDGEAVAEATKALETQVKSCARTIQEKYINPPRTTEFAIMFLPTESLYAEVLRQPGLFDQIQRDFHVTLTGPTTFTALLNALQMGFRTLAIEQRSSEVWQILGGVQLEFGKYNKVVDSLSKQLDTASNSVKQLGVRTRAMNRKLRDVETPLQDSGGGLLGNEVAPPIAADDDDEAPSSA